jgi:hypothetical protein
MIYACYETVRTGTTKIGVMVKELWSIKALRDLNIKLYYKLVSIDHMRDYSINNYLSFNISYKFTINYILVDNDEHINKTNQHELSKDLIIK